MNRADRRRSARHASRGERHYTSPDLPSSRPGERQLPFESPFRAATHPETGALWLLFTSWAIEAEFSDVTRHVVAGLRLADGKWQMGPNGATRVGDAEFPSWLVDWAGEPATASMSGDIITVGAGGPNMPNGARFTAGVVRSVSHELLVPWVTLEGCRFGHPDVPLEAGAGPSGVLAVGGRHEGALRFLIAGDVRVEGAFGGGA